ncbi:MAG: sulfatase-like hydrolase/transferase [Phycisphaerae bacterium]|nr:sulfatase-like hydrolase/transferase [Phycisphaerae bacterium]
MKNWRRCYLCYLIILILTVVVVAAFFVFLQQGFKNRIKGVVLISIDTCRSDHLGCYGYPYQTTPNIDMVAKEGLIFEHMVSQVPVTLPSHSSMLTGLLPPSHGVHDNFEARLAEANKTLAEIMHDNGFTTGAIISAFVLDSQFGIAQGFDSYDDDYNEEEINGIENGRRATETSRLACNWLTDRKTKKFFLFLHFYDPHLPYVPPEPFASAHKGRPYDGEIAYVDACIGKVIQKLKELNLYDKTLVVITGDHGEMMGEHGESDHSFFIYEAAIRVPLIIKKPSGPKGKRIKEVAGVVDILPTICESVGAQIPANVQGINILKTGRPEKGQRYIYTESLYPTKYNGNSLLAVTDGRWKYIQTTNPELYDLSTDPNEMKNLFHLQRKKSDLLQYQLKRLLHNSAEIGIAATKPLKSQEAMQRLSSLGYVAGKMSEENIYDFNQNKIDPKNLIELHEQNKQLGVFTRRKQYEQAKTLCKKMIEEYPQYVQLHQRLGDIMFDSGQVQDAISHYLTFLAKTETDGRTSYKLDEKAIIHDTYQKLALAFSGEKDFEQAVFYFNKVLKIDSNQPAGFHSSFAYALSKVGRIDDAITHCQQGLKLSPEEDTEQEIHDRLAKLYFHKGQYENAVQHWTKMLESKPEQPQVLNDLGAAMFHQHKSDEAIKYWNKSLSIQKNQTQVHSFLAEAFVANGDLPQAVTHWKASLSIEPNQPDLLYRMGQKGFYEQGKVEEAVRYWEKALALRPDWYGLLNGLAWLKATYPDARYRNPQEALRLAQKACELTNHKNYLILDTLAAAYASVGNFPEAIKTAQKAIELAHADPNTRIIQEVERRLELFRNGQAYYQPKK